MPLTSWCAPDDDTCHVATAKYNTDVAFSDKGDILAKYRKSHLTAGSEVRSPPSSSSHLRRNFRDARPIWHRCVQVAAFNEPPPKAVYFDTPFGGRFGMMTCYDIEFKEPASLLLAAGVTNILCAFRVSCAPWPMVHHVTPDRDSAPRT